MLITKRKTLRGAGAYALLLPVMVLPVMLFALMLLVSRSASALDIDMSNATTPDESAVSQTIAVFISSPHSADITVSYTLTDDTAIEGEDYTDNTTGTLVFVAGETVKSINIPIIQDSIDEDTERLFVNLTATTFGNIVTNQVSLYITDDDLPPAISIGDNSSANENAAVTNLTVTLDAASGKTISIDYATSDGTATAGDDYTAISSTPLTFNPGETSKLIPVSVISDSLDEVDETVIITLVNPSNASISDATGVLTISDDDPEPSLSVDNSTTRDENSAEIIVRLSSASEKNISVGLGASSGTATSGADFNSFSSSVSFNAGETIKTVSMPLVNDTLDEDDETFTVTLSGPTNALISSSTATITILDDDPTPTLSIQDVSQNENSGTASAIVLLSAASSKNVTVDYATSNGTATAGDDYTGIATTTLTFSAGQTSKTINTNILSDSMDEDDETFTLTLSSPANATISTTAGSATMTIVDDDPAPTISISDNSSGESGTGNLVASLSAASEKTITIDYATSDGTATAGDDYTAVSTTTLTFNPGDTSKNIPITVVSDNIDEVDETVIVTLSNPLNVTISDGSGELTITDDDNAPTISIDDTVIANEIAVPRSITLSLSTASTQTVEVDYTTSDGTATAINDYVATSGTVTFNPGVTSQTIAVTMVQDNLAETDETFNIDLSNPVNATISDNQSVVTITDDEGIPELSVADVSTSNEAATNLVATVSLSGTSSQIVTIDYATSNGTATAGDDYTGIATTTLTFNPGDLTKTVNIAILSDSMDEDDETFTLTLSSPANATISTTAGSATMTIVDDDPAPTISISDNSSGESGTGNLVASLSAASEKTITIDYATSDGTATAGDDYTAVSTTTLTFNPGDTSKNIPITVVSDNIDEVDETVIVTLSNPLNVTISDGSGELTITDDDNAPTISIDDTVIANETPVSRPVTLRLSTASGNQVTVDYATSDGTASVNNDYNAISGTATFAPGEVTTTLNVTILSDSLAEGDENFFIDLSSPVNASIADNQAEITITDDDDIPSVRIDDAATSDETATALATTITLSGASSSAVTLNWTTADATALAGDDYVLAGGMVMFNPGEVTKTVSVNILDDNIPEGTETFSIRLSNPNAAATISDDTAIMTIIDDDGSPTISASAASAAENDQTVAVEVGLSFTSPLSISVDYTTQDVTAAAGEDYTLTSGTLIFAPGEQTKTVTIPLRPDTAYEDTETFHFVLSNPVNTSISSGTATITITDDDEILSEAQTREITNAILFGKNSALRSETAFFGRILSRNTTLLSRNNTTSDGPVMSFRNVNVNWSDNEEFASGAFSYDNVRENGAKNTSWETSISHTKNDRGTRNTFISTAFNFSKRSSGGTIYGLILGGGYSDTSMTGKSTGSNIGRSVSAGIYSAYPVSTSLMLDLMATRTYEVNTLDTRIGTAHVTGDYDRNSTSLSLGLQGNIEFGASAFRPKLKYTAGKSVFDSAIFDVRQGGLASTQQIDFGTDEYFRFSFTPEFSTILGSRTNLLRPSGFNQFTFRPKVFCEKYDYEADKKCGQGLGLSFGNHHPSYNFNQDFTLDYDKIDGAKTYSMRYKRTY